MSFADFLTFASVPAILLLAIPFLFFSKRRQSMDLDAITIDSVYCLREALRSPNPYDGYYTPNRPKDSKEPNNFDDTHDDVDFILPDGTNDSDDTRDS